MTFIQLGFTGDLREDRSDQQVYIKSLFSFILYFLEITTTSSLNYYNDLDLSQKLNVNDLDLSQKLNVNHLYDSIVNHVRLVILD